MFVTNLCIADMECTADDEPQFMYYVNDGVYGSFNCLMFDHATVETCLLDPQVSTGSCVI